MNEMVIIKEPGNHFEVTHLIYAEAGCVWISGPVAKSFKSGTKVYSYSPDLRTKLNRAIYEQEQAKILEEYIPLYPVDETSNDCDFETKSFDIIRQLDTIARDVNEYDYGLPIHNAESIKKMLAVLKPYLK